MNISHAYPTARMNRSLGTGGIRHQRRRLTQIKTGIVLGLLVLPALCGAAPTVAAGEETSAPLPLPRAIEIALANNPDAAEARWRVDESEASASAARSGRLPTLKTRAAYDYYLDDQRLLAAAYNGEQGVFGPDALGADLILSLSLYTGGRITSEIRASDLLRQASEGQLARTRETIVFNTTSLFYTLLSQEEVIRSLQSAVKAMEEQRRIIDAQVEAQKAARVDSLRAEVRLAELEEKLDKETNVRTVQQWALAALLGWDSPQAPSVTGELRFAESPVSPEAEACLKKAFEGRSDYAAARQSLAAQTESVEVARASYWPTLSLLASYGGRWMPDPSDKPDNGDDLVDVGRVGLMMELPLFEGGLTAARVREQAARLRMADERLRKLELQIRYEVETALSDIASARDRVETASKAVDLARESFRIIQKKYDLGKGALTDVLDAQSALVLAETTQARARADLAISDARMKLAIGEILPGK